MFFSAGKYLKFPIFSKYLLIIWILFYLLIKTWYFLTIFIDVSSKDIKLIDIFSLSWYSSKMEKVNLSPINILRKTVIKILYNFTEFIMIIINIFWNGSNVTINGFFNLIFKLNLKLSFLRRPILSIRQYFCYS